MKGRYYCFTIVIRANQIEVSPGVNIGVDERRENTLENLIKYRTAIARAIPEARITYAISHEALKSDDDNYRAIRAQWIIRTATDRFVIPIILLRSISVNPLRARKILSTA